MVTDWPVLTDGPVDPVALHAALAEAAASAGEHIAVRAGERAWSFADLHRRVGSFAAQLAELGVGRGDRVAVMMTNRVDFAVAVHAISTRGAVAVLLSPAWRTTEVRHALRLTTPRHAVTDGPATALLAGELGQHAVIDVDALGELPDPIAPARVDPTADAVYVFSSGTTGMPKVVRHTHRSIGAATADWVAALGLTNEDRFQIATPPSHILGLLNLLAAVRAGSTVRLHPRFDLDEQLRCIESERMTLEMAVAPIALAMANHPSLEDYDLSSLRYIMWCATPVTESVARRVTARTGVRFLTAYGASEVPLLTANPVHDPSAWRLDSVGLPARDVEIRVVDLETGRPVAPDATGELEVRSPSVMAGYLPPDADRDAFHDGWYRTGDVGRQDQAGWVYLTDRSKELIKVNGFQVAPAELEGVVLTHPGVLDCAVFGVPDERAGEVPVAAVQLDPAHEVDPADLRALVADALASYKQLREVVVVDSVPRLPSGKVLRRELRARWLADRPPAGAGL